MYDDIDLRNNRRVGFWTGYLAGVVSLIAGTFVIFVTMCHV